LSFPLPFSFPSHAGWFEAPAEVLHFDDFTPEANHGDARSSLKWTIELVTALA
jgi:hypothetical protein